MIKCQFLSRTLGQGNPSNQPCYRSPQNGTKVDVKKTFDLGIANSCPLHIHHMCGYLFNDCLPLVHC